MFNSIESAIGTDEVNFDLFWILVNGQNSFTSSYVYYVIYMQLQFRKLGFPDGEISCKVD